MNQCEDIDFRKTWAGLFYAEENWEGLGSAKILTSFPCSFFPRPLLQWLGAHLCRRTGRMKLFCLFSVPCTKTSAPRSWQERKRKEGEGLRVLVLLLIKICWQPTDPFLSKFSCATHYHPAAPAPLLWRDMWIKDLHIRCSFAVFLLGVCGLLNSHCCVWRTSRLRLSLERFLSSCLKGHSLLISA